MQANAQDEGNKVVSTSTVKLTNADGEEVTEAAIGIGPVDATFKAILRIIDRPVQLTQYTVTKIHGGTDSPGNDALASIVLHIQSPNAAQQERPKDFPSKSSGIYFADGRSLGVLTQEKQNTYTGTGTSTDIIVASARAYLFAINRMIDAEDGDGPLARRTSQQAGS